MNDVISRYEADELSLEELVVESIELMDTSVSVGLEKSEALALLRFLFVSRDDLSSTEFSSSAKRSLAKLFCLFTFAEAKDESVLFVATFASILFRSTSSTQTSSFLSIITTTNESSILLLTVKLLYLLSSKEDAAATELWRCTFHSRVSGEVSGLCMHAVLVSMSILNEEEQESVMESACRVLRNLMLNDAAGCGSFLFASILSVVQTHTKSVPHSFGSTIRSFLVRLKKDGESSKCKSLVAKALTLAMNSSVLEEEGKKHSTGSKRSSSSSSSTYHTMSLLKNVSFLSPPSIALDVIKTVILQSSSRSKDRIDALQHVATEYLSTTSSSSLSLSNKIKQRPKVQLEEEVVGTNDVMMVVGGDDEEEEENEEVLTTKRCAIMTIFSSIMSDPLEGVRSTGLELVKKFVVCKLITKDMLRFLLLKLRDEKEKVASQATQVIRKIGSLPFIDLLSVNELQQAIQAIVNVLVEAPDSLTSLSPLLVEMLAHTKKLPSLENLSPKLAISFANAITASSSSSSSSSPPPPP